MLCVVCNKRTAIVFEYGIVSHELAADELAQVDSETKRPLCAACATGLRPVDFDASRSEMAALAARTDDIAEYDRAFLAQQLIGCAIENHQSLPVDLEHFAQRYSPPSA